MTVLLTILGVLVGVAALLWLIGANEPVYKATTKGPAWFVALKGPANLAPGARSLWSSAADFALIGANEPYWTRFHIVASETNPLPDDAAVEDAFVARIAMTAPPKLALGILRTLIAIGVLSRPPTGDVAHDGQGMGFRDDVMPNAKAVETLLAQPASYAPSMVNFLHYYDTAKYARGGSGKAAYQRYGAVALKTVHRTGGALLFYGSVTEIVRAAKAGPCVGVWDDVAAMRYSNPAGILSMERVPEYRAALGHRDAGLERTVVIASH